MMRRSWKLLAPAIALMLAATLVLGSAGVAEAKAEKAWKGLKDLEKFIEKAEKNMKKLGNLRFSDCDEAAWALEVIAKMKALGIITGYPGNVFKPNSAVKQAEALTMMVRAFDLEDRAKELAGSSWAVGYIQVALDEGWVELPELRPNAPADRSWVAMVMVRAMGLEDKAQAKMGATLPFKDAKAIPRDRIGYVAVAVELNLFKGYTDHTFQPNKPVTRAELAAVISRMLDEELPDETPFRVTGYIEAINPAKRTMTLKSESGKHFAYTISTDVLVVIGKGSGALTDLRVGDRVEVLSNNDNVALLITLKGRPDTPARKLTGEIVAKIEPPALTLKIAGQPNKTVILADSCTIYEGSIKRTFGNLRLGDTVQVTLVDDLVTAIVILAREGDVQYLTGTVTGIEETVEGTTEKRFLTVKDTGGHSHRVELHKNVVVEYKAQDMSPSLIAVGDAVTLRLEKGICTRVTITARHQEVHPDAAGVISEVKYGTDRTDIVVKTTPRQLQLRLSARVRITYSGVTLGVGDLEPGDQVELGIENNLVMWIKILKRNVRVPFGDFGGKIVGLYFGETNRVTIDDGEKERTVTLSSNVTVTDEDQTADMAPSTLRIGHIVRVQMKDNLVTEIRICKQ